MSKVILLIAVMSSFSIMAASIDVSLSGTVKDGSGAAIGGATVGLVKQSSLTTTTNATGAFTLTGSITRVTVPYAVSIGNSITAGIRMKTLRFSIPADGRKGTISIFSNSGRMVANFSFANVKAGSHIQTLPDLSAGFYVVSISIDGITVSYKLVATGSAMYLSDMNGIGANKTVSIQNSASAAAVDTLIVKKTGYDDAKVPVESYTKSGIAIVLTKATVPECKLPALPEPSGLTKVNDKLPDPFTFYDGTKMTKKSQWECRRKEILAMASKYVYGPYPPKPDEVTGTVSGGNITINCRVGSKTQTFSATISGSGTAICLKLSGGIYPSNAKTLSVGSGNASKIQNLYGISGMIENLATAWMVDRVMDVLELNPNSGHDPTKLMVSGCSGCGKGAFLVGVFSRIPLTVIVESGGGGAASFRMCEWFRHGAGSSIYKCADAKPQGIDNLEDNGICGPWVSSVASWVRSNPAKVKNLPFDQHLLLACIAPRYLCHFTNQHGQNEWCHLGGTCEALSAWAAKPVFKALGIPENMGFRMYTEGSAPGHCSNPSSASSLANEFFKRVFQDDKSAKTDVWEANDKDLQQPQGEWKAMWVDWDMDTKLE